MALMGFMIHMTSCEDIKFGEAFLEMPQSETINIDTVFNSRFYAEQVLADSYKSLPDHTSADNKLQWSVLEVLTDLAEKCNGPSHYQSGQMTASTTTSSPYVLYNVASSSKGVMSPMYGIRQAYIYIENVDKVPDMTAEEKKTRKAEARGVIAYLYAEMFRYMGGMPVATKSYGLTDDFAMTRMSVADMVDAIVKMCDKAAPDLPWYQSETENGRMTAAAVMALKFRVLLHAASPLYNSEEPVMPEAASMPFLWYGGYDAQRWQRALDAGLDFLERNQTEGNYYQLYGYEEGLTLDMNNADDFQKIRDNYAAAYLNRNNKELIIEGHRFTTFNSSYKWVAQARYNCMVPSQNLHNKFQMLSGEPFDWTNEDHKANPFWQSLTQAEVKDLKFSPLPVRDPRLYETMQIHGDRVKDASARFDITNKSSFSGAYGSNIDSKGGTNMRKYIRNNGTQLKNHPYVCALLRLPEVYLGIAECMNELGKANEVDKLGRNAYDYVNLVRNRSGMPSIGESGMTNEFLNIPSGTELTEYILDERCREFAYEDMRYFDIARRKRDDILKLPEVGMKIQKEGDAYSYETNISFPNARLWIDNWSNRYYFVPIPQAEIDKQYGLIQTPGWE